MSWKRKVEVDWFDEYARRNTNVPDDQIVIGSLPRSKRLAREVERLISLMGFSDNDRVLDAGCGAGRFLSRIGKRCNCQLLGFDTSRSMIERARKKVPNAGYVLADVLHPPFRGGVFTAVVCCSVLWHVPSERNRFINSDIYEWGLREFKRVLTKNGRLLFDISNPFRLQGIVDFVISLRSKNAYQTYRLHVGMAKSILSRLGFKVSDIIVGERYLVPLEAVYLLFRRQPSENMIDSYYDSFKPLDRFAWARMLLPPEGFVIKAIS